MAFELRSLKTQPPVSSGTMQVHLSFAYIHPAEKYAFFKLQETKNIDET